METSKSLVCSPDITTNWLPRVNSNVSQSHVNIIPNKTKIYKVTFLKSLNVNSVWFFSCPFSKAQCQCLRRHQLFPVGPLLFRSFPVIWGGLLGIIRAFLGHPTQKGSWDMCNQRRRPPRWRGCREARRADTLMAVLSSRSCPHHYRGIIKTC